ncbi:hypothetical protein [Propionicimonas paludicola]|uniref:hypothetical protein n=1 Tax=Propionicimonas paludicola TaxID=185243 RepID=UPI001475BC6C|nr:hypothetical protein [Propionicimonas paludicola]
MNHAELQRLAAAVHQLRPDWRVDSLATFLRRTSAHRPLWDVARELVWIALEPGTAPGTYANTTPALLEHDGPWRAALIPTISQTPIPLGWCSLHQCEDSQRHPCRDCARSRAEALHDPERIRQIRTEAAAELAQENPCN